MKDYIKFYKYDADYQAAKPNLPEPHAVYCWETNIVDISAPVFNEKQYLAFKAVDGDATLTIKNKGGAAPQLYFSYDQESWTDWTAAGYGEITIYDGRKVYLKGNNACMGYNASKYSTFGGTGKYEVSGSISSLLNGDDIFGNLTLSTTYSFAYLFNNNKQIISANDLLLPYTTLTNNCYASLFQGCSALATAPAELPATTLANECYAYMFEYCVFTEAPELPATTLGRECYSRMFQNCPSLTSVIIYAESISSYQCIWMFCYSSNVKEIILPNCTSFTSQSYFSNGVSSTGVLKCLRALTDIPRGRDGIPTNWTIEYLD